MKPEEAKKSKEIFELSIEHLASRASDPLDFLDQSRRIWNDYWKGSENSTGTSRIDTRLEVQTLLQSVLVPIVDGAERSNAAAKADIMKEAIFKVLRNHFSAMNKDISGEFKLVFGEWSLMQRVNARAPSGHNDTYNTILKPDLSYGFTIVKPTKPYIGPLLIVGESISKPGHDRWTMFIHALVALRVLRIFLSACRDRSKSSVDPLILALYLSEDLELSFYLLGFADNSTVSSKTGTII